MSLRVLAGLEPVELLAAPVSVPAGFIGMHLHRWPGTDPAPSFPFGTFRTHDCEGMRWRNIEKARGEYDWKRADEVMAAHKGREVIWTLCGHPEWAVPEPELAYLDPYGSPGGGAVPVDFEDMARFALEVWKRYGVGTFEVGNEPTLTGERLGNWWGTASQLVGQTLAVYRALKGQSYKIKVLNGGLDGAPHKVAQFLNSEHEGVKGWRCIDGVAIHQYGSQPIIGKTDDVLYTQGMGLMHVRAMIEALGCSLPIYVTEYGWFSDHAAPGVETMLGQHFIERRNRMSRTNLLFAAMGVKVLCWYAYGNMLSGDFKTDESGVKAATYHYHTHLAGQTLVSCTIRRDGFMRAVRSDGFQFSA